MTYSADAIIIKPDVVSPPGAYEQYTELSSGELRAIVRQSLAHTAEMITQAAAAVRCLEDRGESLDDLDVGILVYLRKVAYGQVVPQLLVRYADRPLLLKTLMGLPIPEQRAIADGGRVKLMVKDHETNQYSHLLADPSEMTAAQFRLAFSDRGIRSESEQRLRLESAPKPISGLQPPKSSRISINRKTGTLEMSKGHYKPAEIQEALARLADRDDDTDGEERVAVTTNLSASAAAALKLAAVERGTNASALIRRILIASGITAPRGNP